MFNPKSNVLFQKIRKSRQLLHEKVKNFKPYNLGSVAINHFTPKKGYIARTNIAYGLKARQRLDLYLSNKQSKKPLIVFVYGGAWTSGEKTTYKFVGEAFARYGYDVAIVNYHLAPEHIFPSYIDDLDLALNYLDANQEKLGISTENIALMGHSAGAFNIASLLYHPQKYESKIKQNIKALIGISGPYHFDYKGDPLAQFAFDQNIPFQQVMPYYFVEQNQIQHYLLIAENDKIVGDHNSFDFQTELKEKGNHCEVISIAKTGHISIMGSVSSLFSPFFDTRKVIVEALNKSFHSN